MGKYTRPENDFTDAGVTASPPLDTRSVDTIFEHLRNSINTLSDARYFHRQFKLGNITTIPDHLTDIQLIGASVTSNVSAFVDAINAINSGAMRDPAGD